MSVPGRWCVAAAAATAVGVAAPWWVAAMVAACVLAIGRRRFAVTGPAALAALVLLGAVSSTASSARTAALVDSALPDGAVDLTVDIRSDVATPVGHGAIGVPVAVDGSAWSGPPLLVRSLSSPVEAGDRLEVRATVRPGPRRVGRDLVAGLVDVHDIVESTSSRNPILTMGNAIRRRVRAVFGAPSPAAALATGLLVGDTSRLPARSMEDLRRAGLAHFVAVSGSNVALFLGAWWIVGAPLSIHPRLRVAFGFLGLAVFLVATRWEPSVVRASVMAAIPLGGALLSVPVDPWMALGIAVTMLLLVSGDLLGSVGFQLSVLATAGVLVGVHAVRGRRPAWLWVPLGATVGAQAAVAPILLVVFGTVPLVAPAANLVAAPIVTLATVAGLAAVAMPIAPFVGIATTAAGAVLGIASVSADGPQLGVGGAVLAAAIGALIAARWARPLGLAAAGIVVLLSAGGGPVWPTTPSVVVMQVGQGDAILIQDPGGRAALVDGGRDPRVLDRALRRQGVARLDAVVITHGDADHVGGIVDLVATADIGEVWVPDHAREEGLLADAIDAAERRGIPVRRVGRGDAARLGPIDLAVLSPHRRFDGDNDGSIVLMVSAGISMLLPGDIGAVAQRELPDLRPDAMVVPHHGSATTDLAWLARTVGGVAVLSYGPNTFGHPHPDVVDVLESAGADVHHTHLDGDVRVRLDRPEATTR